MILYIIFTGPDCSGKSYLSNKLYNNLKNNNSLDNKTDLLLISEPYKDTSFKCNNIFLQSHLFIFNEQRRYFSNLIYQKKNRKSLYELFLKDRKLNLKSLQYLYDIYSRENKDLIIIQDRSYFSTLVYQPLTNNISEEVILNDHRNMFKNTPDVIPDTIIYTTVDEDILVNRLKLKKDLDHLDNFFRENMAKMNNRYDEIILNVKKDKRKYLLKDTTEIITYNYNS